MTLDALIILVGALIALVPSLGFPYSWDYVIFFVLGVFVVALGIVVRRRLSHKNNPHAEQKDVTVHSSDTRSITQDDSSRTIV